MQKHNGGVILITKSFQAPSVGGCCLMQTWKLVLVIGLGGRGMPRLEVKLRTIRCTNNVLNLIPYSKSSFLNC